MGLFNNKIKEELEYYKNEYNNLKEINNKLEKEIKDAHFEIATVKFNNEKVDKERKTIESKIEEANEKLKNINLDISTIECDLYVPIEKGITSKEYREKLVSIRKKIKKQFKEEILCLYKFNDNMDYYLGNKINTTQVYRELYHQSIKIINLKAELVLEKLTSTNFKELCSDYIFTCKEQIEKMESFNLVISKEYVDLRLQEINILYGYLLLKEQEKEDKRIQAQIIKEQKEADKELEDNRKRLEKEKVHYENQMKSIEDKTLNRNVIMSIEQQTKYDEIKTVVEELNVKIKDNDYRLFNNKAGYLYIISNNDMKDEYYKIGVSRRTDPMERINELGNASHIFKFNVHGIIFSEDCFKLESELHKYFDKNRVNKVRKQKEFFNISLEEVEKALQMFGYDVELDKEVINEEYLLSI